MMNHGQIILPDLGLADQPIVLSLWLVKEGALIVEGEPVVEVMAEGESLAVGQRLAEIQS